MWGTLHGARVWIDDEGYLTVWVWCDACPPTEKWPNGIPAYYERDEVWGMSHWCWKHAPKDATPIPV